MTDPIPLYTHTAMRVVTERDININKTIGPACEVYPIIFPEEILVDPDLDGNVDYDPFNPPSSGIPVEVFEGSGRGGFGWLNWDPGENDELYIAEELYNPRLSMQDFTGLTPPPDLDPDPINTSLNIGDWVSSSTGTVTSVEVQNQLADLSNALFIRVPVYDRSEVHGSGIGYHIAHFALISINQVCMPSNQCGQSLGLSGSDKVIFATFLRFDDEACLGDDP